MPKKKPINPLIVQAIERSHPNIGSPMATPMSRYLDSHYNRLLVVERWTWERYLRMANFLKMTPYELGSVAGIPHATIRRWQMRTILPMSKEYGAIPTALILTMLEAHYLGPYLNDVIENPFPNCNPQPTPAGK